MTSNTAQLTFTVDGSKQILLSSVIFYDFANLVVFNYAGKSNWIVHLFLNMVCCNSSLMEILCIL